jgi:hypothetical protein
MIGCDRQYKIEPEHSQRFSLTCFVFRLFHNGYMRTHAVFVAAPFLTLLSNILSDSVAPDIHRFAERPSRHQFARWARLWSAGDGIARRLSVFLPGFLDLSIITSYRNAASRASQRV